MKSIKLSHDTKNAIKHYDNSKSYDKAINCLIKEVEMYMPVVDYSDSSKTVVSIHEDTVDRIKSFRLSDGESVENILIRMLIMSQALNSGDE